MKPRRPNPLDVIAGLSAGEFGDYAKAAFPYVHAAGKGLAGAFGAGAAAQALEDVEVKHGWLPPLAKPIASAAMPTPPTTPTTLPGNAHPLGPVAASLPRKAQPQSTFLERFHAPIRVAAGGAFVVGALMLVRHLARKK